APSSTLFPYTTLFRSFVQGLKEAGLSLFLWGIFATVMPFVIGLLAGKYIFKMHPAILLGACAGARTTTAALGAIQDEAQSKVPRSEEHTSELQSLTNL